MFDLEPSIARWRTQMLAAGINTPVPLEELENHLREEIGRQLKSGFNEQNAFEISIQQIGQPKMLNREFQKCEMSFMKICKILAGFLLGATMQLPGSLELRDKLVMADGKLGLWLVGFILQMWAMSSLWRMLRPGTNQIEFEKFTLSYSRIVKTGAGVAVLLGGIMLMIPTGIQASRDGLVKFDALGWLIFGFALLIAGALVTFCPYKRHRA